MLYRLGGVREGTISPANSITLHRLVIANAGDCGQGGGRDLRSCWITCRGSLQKWAIDGDELGEPEGNKNRSNRVQGLVGGIADSLQFFCIFIAECGIN